MGDGLAKGLQHGIVGFCDKGVWKVRIRRD